MSHDIHLLYSTCKIQSVHVRCVYRTKFKPSCTVNQKCMATKSQLGKTHSYISSNITIHITFTAKYHFFIQSTSITIPNIAEAFLNKFVFQPLIKISKKHFFIYQYQYHTIIATLASNKSLATPHIHHLHL